MLFDIISSWYALSEENNDLSNEPQEIWRDIEKEIYKKEVTNL